MGMIEIASADGLRYGAYENAPQRPGRQRAGAVVVLQEIFGANSHIRAICDRFAAHGFTAIAPALFDRRVRNFESGYSAPEIDAAREIPLRIDWSLMLMDLQAAIDSAMESIDLCPVVTRRPRPPPVRSRRRR